MSVGWVRRWLADGAHWTCRCRVRVPPRTVGVGWPKLAECDIVAGRLAEAHVDATAILADLGSAHGPHFSTPLVMEVYQCGRDDYPNA